MMYTPTIVFSLAAFIGNFGVSLTGFGMAIFFLFVYTIGDFSGAMTCDRCGIKDAVFYQSLALACGLPFMLFQARNVIKEHRNKTLLLTFIPATAASTPLGNFLQSHLPGDIVKVVCGILICIALANSLQNLIPETQCYKKHISKEVVNSNDKDENENDAINADIEGGEKSADEGGQPEQSSVVDDDDVVDKDNADTVEINADELSEAKCAESVIDVDILEGWPLRFWGAIAGLFSGFLGGLAGIRGPPMMVFFLSFPFPKHVVRANSMLTLVVNVTIRMIYYTAEDVSRSSGNPWFDSELWFMYVSVVAWGILGIPFGNYVADQIDQNHFKLVIVFMLFLSGFSNLLKGSIEIAQR